MLRTHRLLHRRFVLALKCALGALAFLAGSGSRGGGAAERRPNLLLIVADDLGYGDLGCYGQKRIQTPVLDSMAKSGLRFTDFYAGSTVCAPSRCVLMTGQHTGHCRIRGNARHPLLPEDVTLAERLKELGYATALVGKWGLGEEGSSGTPNRQGFDYFFGYLNQHHAHNYYPAYLFRNAERVPLRNVVPGAGPYGSGVATKKVEYSHDLFVEEALAFLDRAAQRPEQPFFLYLALTAPHANNEAGKAGMEVPDLAPYAQENWPPANQAHAAMITRMDRDLGRLFERLKERGAADQTVVLFTSDNGPHREGGNNPEFFDSNGPLQGIKRSLHDGGIRVPLLATGPGIRPGVTARVGDFADLVPTLVDLAGGAVPREGIDAVSLAPTLLGRSARDERAYRYWEFYEGGFKQAVRSGAWKAIRAGGTGKPVQLFDLTRDLGETTDLSASEPEVAARLAAAMDEAHVPSPLWGPAGGGGKQP